MRIEPMELRHREGVVDILSKASIFNSEELTVALELSDSYLNGGGDYIIKVAVDNKGPVEGYICYGRTPLTDGVYHLYWIAVNPSQQGRGIGTELMKAMENEVVLMRGRMILLETSSTSKYQAAREFYSANGYRHIATVKDFYKVGDDLLIYKKDLKLLT